MPNSATSTWSCSVGRGPDCLVVKLHPPKNGQLGEYQLAEDLLRMLDEQFKRRLVLEMDEVSVVLSAMLRELITLHKRISANGGFLRLSGLSDAATETLQSTNLEGVLPTYISSRDAIMTFHRPHPVLKKPR